MVEAGRKIFLSFLQPCVPGSWESACLCSLKRKPIDECSKEVKMMEPVLAAIVSLCFRGSCGFRRKSTRCESRKSLPVSNRWLNIASSRTAFYRLPWMSLQHLSDSLSVAFVHLSFGSLSHSLVHSSIHALTHSLSPSVIHFFIHSFPHLPIHSLIQAFPHSFPHSSSNWFIPHSLTHSFIFFHPLIHSL